MESKARESAKAMSLAFVLLDFQIFDNNIIPGRRRNYSNTVPNAQLITYALSSSVDPEPLRLVCSAVSKLSRFNL